MLHKIFFILAILGSSLYASDFLKASKKKGQVIPIVPIHDPEGIYYYLHPLTLKSLVLLNSTYSKKYTRIE
jgi:hypothetical protein